VHIASLPLRVSYLHLLFSSHFTLPALSPQFPCRPPHPTHRPLAPYATPMTPRTQLFAKEKGGGGSVTVPSNSPPTPPDPTCNILLMASLYSLAVFNSSANTSTCGARNTEQTRMREPTPRMHMITPHRRSPCE